MNGHTHMEWMDLIHSLRLELPIIWLPGINSLILNNSLGLNITKSLIWSGVFLIPRASVSPAAAMWILVTHVLLLLTIPAQTSLPHLSGDKAELSPHCEQPERAGCSMKKGSMYKLNYGTWNPLRKLIIFF